MKQVSPKIIEYVLSHKEIIATDLMTKYKIGFPKAIAILTKLEDLGIVGPPNGSQPRRVLK